MRHSVIEYLANQRCASGILWCTWDPRLTSQKWPWLTHIKYGESKVVVSGPDRLKLSMTSQLLKLTIRNFSS